MKQFGMMELAEALAYAAAGGQALHLHRVVFGHSPRCFKAAVNRGEDIAHLFDLDADRLRKAARRLGVRVVFIDKEGTPRQHVDLCGKPLANALAECEL